MHVEKRSNRVHSPLIVVPGVATRRAGLAWGRTRAEKEIQPRAFVLDRRAGRGDTPSRAGGGAGERTGAGWVALFHPPVGGPQG
ncbi:hypothetical protein Pa4123_28200 [Phytohabitans aurantiacus]|uniref:Uncharacterized protein n=1 Tax=Phytohabitans aurantiacus TaxID=3016789 RepID=A0ABQ5QW05_9ACTN|nr:hypothetical protein Pa4123_28200 [Phytohabitans aurantiacus]